MKIEGGSHASILGFAAVPGIYDNPSNFSEGKRSFLEFATLLGQLHYGRGSLCITLYGLQGERAHRCLRPRYLSKPIALADGNQLR